MHDVHSTGASEQIKALEEETSSLKLELETMSSEKRRKRSSLAINHRSRHVGEEVEEFIALNSLVESYHLIRLNVSRMHFP